MSKTLLKSLPGDYVTGIMKIHMSRQLTNCMGVLNVLDTTCAMDMQIEPIIISTLLLIGT